MRFILCLLWTVSVGLVFYELMDFNFLDKDYSVNEAVNPQEEKFEIPKAVPITEVENSQSEEQQYDSVLADTDKEMGAEDRLNELNSVIEGETTEKSSIVSSRINPKENTHTLEKIDAFKDYVQYFVFDRYFAKDVDKQKLFNFSGELKKVQISPKHKLFLYVKMFRDGDHIVGENIKELSMVNQKFMLSVPLSEYDGFETIQFGFLIEGPRIEDSNNTVILEAGPWIKENSINSNQSINTTVSPNVNNAWVLGYSSLKNFQEGILAFSRWANRNEIKFSIDRENKLLKVFANFR